MEKQHENKKSMEKQRGYCRGNVTFGKPTIVTYTHRWLRLFMMYNTVVVRVYTKEPGLPPRASDEELKKKIKEMTGHKVISVISKASY